MFELFKRLVFAPVKQTRPQRPKPTSSRGRAHDPGEPILLPEVREGNEETDWDLWQDSVDSQAAPLSRSPSAYASTMPSQLDDLDPFARVRKNRDI